MVEKSVSYVSNVINLVSKLTNMGKIDWSVVSVKRFSNVRHESNRDKSYSVERVQLEELFAGKTHFETMEDCEIYFTRNNENESSEDIIGKSASSENHNTYHLNFGEIDVEIDELDVAEKLYNVICESLNTNPSLTEKKKSFCDMLEKEANTSEKTEEKKS